MIGEVADFRVSFLLQAVDFGRAGFLHDSLIKLPDVTSENWIYGRIIQGSLLDCLRELPDGGFLLLLSFGGHGSRTGEFLLRQTKFLACYCELAAQLCVALIA